MSLIGEPWWEKAPLQQFNIGTAGRQIRRLGAPNELREQTASHSDFEDWQRTYAAAEVEETEQRAAAQARMDLIEAHQAPRRDAVKRFNEIAAEQLVSWCGFGSLDGSLSVNGWLASTAVCAPTSPASKPSACTPRRSTRRRSFCAAVFGC